MRTYSSPPFTNPRRRKSSRRGFSLVFTLLMMVLLTIIALGLLSLSTITLRSGQAETSMSVARANARLALQLAIGELQTGAGPDRRVTAAGSIDKSASPDRKHYTGVWSTINWKANSPTRRTFVKWLASAATPSIQSTDVRLPLPANTVTLLGAGTLGTNSADTVKAELLRVPTSKATTPATGTVGMGGYAWWVSDESQKARYDLPDQLAAVTTDAAKRLRLTTPQHMGIQAIGDLSAYGDKSKQDSATGGPYQIQKAISMKEAGLFGGVGSNVMGRHFHDVTTVSRSLITDVRNGGFKRDLSLAFELPLTNFHSTQEFTNSQEQNNTSLYPSALASNPSYYAGNYNLGFLFQIPSANASATMRGPTWDLLRDHYRSYKREWETLSYRGFTTTNADGVIARPSTPFNFCAGGTPTTINSAGGSVQAGSYFSMAAMGGKNAITYQTHMKSPVGQPASGTSPTGTPSDGPDPSTGTVSAPRYPRATSSNVVPVVIRFTLALGVGVDALNPGTPGSPPTVGITIDPFLTIWNPYDRPLVFQSIGCFFTKFNGLTFNLATSTGNKSYTFDPNMIGQGAYHFALPASTYTLAPGEVKILGSSTGSTQVVDRSTVNCIAGQIGYNDQSRIFLRPNDGTALTPESNVTVTMSDSQTTENQIADIFLMYGRGPSGSPRDPVKTTPYPNASGVDPAEAPAIDESNTQRLCWRGLGILGDSGLNSPYTKTVASPTAVGTKGGFICAIDVRQDNTTADDTNPFGQFNPRAQSVANIDYSDSPLVPNWSRKILNAGSLTDLQLGSVTGNAYWGNSNMSSGQRNVVMFEIPRSPLTSLGSLQHADAGFLSNHPAYMIANSLAPASFATADLTKLAISRSAGGSYTKWVQPHFDMSWAANDALWDRYFFSGANYGTGSTNTTTTQIATALAKGDSTVLANRRFHLNDAQSNPSALPTDLTKFDKIASRLAYDGGFNVNSTSVDAWKALLSSLNDQEILQGTTTARFPNPLSRYTQPVGTPTDRWKGFHSLTDDQITKLATAIVTEVQNRGPFMGLADFVNRRLVADESQGGCGALQAAIQNASLAAAGSNPSAAAGVTIRGGGSETGIAGSLIQGDILSSLGSTLTARGDTFVIRTYGECRDPSDKVVAQAWCEAVVQRSAQPLVPVATTLDDTIPNPVYPSVVTPGDLPTPQFIANPSLPALYTSMGRRFEVVSFRWLSPSEV